MASSTPLEEWWLAINEDGRIVAFTPDQQSAHKALLGSGGGFGRVKRLVDLQEFRRGQRGIKWAAKQTRTQWNAERRAADEWDCWRCGCSIEAGTMYRDLRSGASVLRVCLDCYQGVSP